MSDTWSDIQAIKEKQLSLREKLQRRKKEREGLVAGITGADVTTAVSPSAAVSGSYKTSTSRSVSPAPGQIQTPASKPDNPLVKVDKELLASVEKHLVLYLCDVTLEFPIDATILHNYVKRNMGKDVAMSVVEDLLQKLAAQQMISISKQDSDGASQQSTFQVRSTDHSKLSAMANELGGPKSPDVKSKKRKYDSDCDGKEEPQSKVSNKQDSDPPSDSIESLLSMQSAKERENKKVHEEILQLLSKPTAKEQSIVENFRSQGGAQVQEFCQFGTKEECFRSSDNHRACTKLHFKKIIHKHTDESLGDCSFLNTCFHMDTCKYVHYEIDYPENVPMTKPDMAVMKKTKDNSTILYPPQWIQCDVRGLDMSILGKFMVIMADPPWDIHMELPYGTMSDDEMRKLAVPSLQDDGFIFLWVTGRAMELGRECLKLWGYERIDEVIWVKTNQLQRIIRTGRTGHWLNHGKEHCLVGVKGNPKNVNKGLDCDVIVAEVRATSHKPDEIYGIIERLAPGTRKIELFGRPHNVQPNWVTLGNQLDGVRLLDPEIVNNFKKLYPDGNCMKPSGP